MPDSAVVADSCWRRGRRCCPVCPKARSYGTFIEIAKDDVGAISRRSGSLAGLFVECCSPSAQGGAGGQDLSGQRRGSTVAGKSGLERRDALRALLVLGAAVPLAGACARPAPAAALTSRQLAGQRVIYSYAGLTPP